MVFREWGVLSLRSEGIATVNSVSRIRNNSWCEYNMPFFVYVLFYFIFAISSITCSHTHILHMNFTSYGFCKRLDGNGNWCKFSKNRKTHTNPWIHINTQFHFNSAICLLAKIVKDFSLLKLTRSLYTNTHTHTHIFWACLFTWIYVWVCLWFFVANAICFICSLSSLSGSRCLCDMNVLFVFVAQKIMKFSLIEPSIWQHHSSCDAIYSVNLTNACNDFHLITNLTLRSPYPQSLQLTLSCSLAHTLIQNDAQSISLWHIVAFPLCLLLSSYYFSQSIYMMFAAVYESFLKQETMLLILLHRYRWFDTQF